MSEVTLRWVPRHYWVRLCLLPTRRCDPGHAWMYYGLVRRDVWRLGPLSFVLMRLPREPEYRRDGE